LTSFVVLRREESLEDGSATSDCLLSTTSLLVILDQYQLLGFQRRCSQNTRKELDSQIKHLNMAKTTKLNH
jgi:hypothetical protein